LKDHPRWGPAKATVKKSTREGESVEAASSTGSLPLTIHEGVKAAKLKNQRQDALLLIAKQDEAKVSLQKRKVDNHASFQAVKLGMAAYSMPKSFYDDMDEEAKDFFEKVKATARLEAERLRSASEADDFMSSPLKKKSKTTKSKAVIQVSSESEKENDEDLDSQADD
jgi:hypothetical protein